MDIRKIIIIGSGPAGYTAGIYTARAELRPLLLAGSQPGGQLISTGLVENWPGSKSGVTGPDLMAEMRQQAEKFGAEFLEEEIKSVKKDKNEFVMDIEGEIILGKSLIVALGTENRQLNIPGEKEYWGRGISNCAICDGNFYKDKIVAVIGGGKAAIWKLPIFRILQKRF